MVRKTDEEFKKEAKIKNQWVTVIGEYITQNHQVLVECNICHRQYLMWPQAVLQGCKCIKCSDKEKGEKCRLSIQEATDRLNKTNPNLEIIGEYQGTGKPILVKCKKCGEEFTITLSNAFQRGVKCPNCENRYNRKTQEYFEEQVKKVSPNIKILGKYVNGETRIECQCTICGHIWTPKATWLQQGKGCPHCNSSKGERRIESFLLENNINFNSQYKFAECKDINELPFDFYLPEYNICIEFDGKQHYEEVAGWGNARLDISQQHDEIKNNFCKENEITLIRIPYWDLKNIDTILTKQLLES